MKNLNDLIGTLDELSKKETPSPTQTEQGLMGTFNGTLLVEADVVLPYLKQLSELQSR